MRSTDAFWEDRCGECNVTLHHAGHAIAHTVRWIAGASPDRSGDVGRSVRVLCTGVDKVNLIRLDGAVGFISHPVMDDGAMFAGAGDRGETLTAKSLDFTAERQQRLGGRHFRLAPG